MGVLTFTLHFNHCACESVFGSIFWCSSSRLWVSWAPLMLLNEKLFQLCFLWTNVHDKSIINFQILNISNFVWIVIELFLFLHWVSIFSTQQSVFRKFRIFISVAVKRSNVSCVLWIWRFSRYGSLTNILKRKLWNLKQSKKDAKIKIDYLVFTVGKFKGSSWGIYCSTIQC